MTPDTKEKYNDRMRELTNKLENGVKELFESKKYKDYLNMLGRFHSYSFNNILLIQMQKPDASLVAGYKTWQTLERQVKKGEKGITILIPCPYKRMMDVERIDPLTKQPVRDLNGNVVTDQKEVTYTSFKTASIFDVSQTEGKALPSLTEELSGQVQDYQILMDSIREVAPAPIHFEGWYESKKGYYSLSNKEIVIKSGMSEMQTIKTAVHEMAHSILHKDIAHLKDSATMEVEAESIAYVVCQSLGLDTSDYSFGYLAGWSANKELPELQSSLATIQKTAHMMIGQLEAQIQKRTHKHENIENIMELPSLTESHIHRR